MWKGEWKNNMIESLIRELIRYSDLLNTLLPLDLAEKYTLVSEEVVEFLKKDSDAEQAQTRLLYLDVRHPKSNLTIF